MYQILIIENETIVRESLSAILTRNNYRVITAKDGKTGVQRALQQTIDLIICAAHLPELDGFAVLQLLSNHHRTTSTPFIFMTAQADKGIFGPGMDYITRPFEVALLLQTVERCLKKLEYIAHHSLTSSHFGNCADNDKVLSLMNDMSAHQELRHYAKKDLVFEENSYPRHLFYLEKGLIKLYKTNAEGREFIIRMVGPGEFFGYLPLLKNSLYTQSATVLDPADLRLFLKKDFQALVFNNCDVNNLFMKMLADRICGQEQMLLNLAYNSVRKRVSSTLVGLHEHHQMDIHFLRDDLAAIVGTAKETLIRTLTDFKTEELIEINKGQITVKNVEKLRALHH